MANMWSLDVQPLSTEDMQTGRRTVPLALAGCGAALEHETTKAQTRPSNTFTPKKTTPVNIKQLPLCIILVEQHFGAKPLHLSSFTAVGGGETLADDLICANHGHRTAESNEGTSVRRSH